MNSPDAARPLLSQSQLPATPSTLTYASSYTPRQRLRRWRARLRALLDSRKKHYFVLAIVSLDVACLLANVLIELVACDMGLEGEAWVGETKTGLTLAGLVFSCVFVGELGLCVLAFGFGYFSSWFHTFDAIVILASLVIDLVVTGVAEEIASLVIMLRLWRFVKVVEELSVGAAERMETLRQEMDRLREENRVMGIQLARQRREDGEESDDEDGAFQDGRRRWS